MSNEPTPEQQAILTASRDESIRIVTEIGVDPVQFQHAASICYHAIGLEPPAVAFAASPTEALLMTSYATDDVFRAKWDKRYGTSSKMVEYLQAQEDVNLSKPLYDKDAELLPFPDAPSPVLSQDELFGQRQQWQATLADLRDNLGPKFYSDFSSKLNSVHWGGWRMAWISHWLKVSEFPGMEAPTPEMRRVLEAYRIFSTPIMVIPMDGYVVVCNKHNHISVEDNQLHSTTGPAWQWENGEAMWAWHNTKVPEWVIMNPTAEAIAAERNTEIRRCAIESLGWAEYLDQIHAKPVSVELDPGNFDHEGTQHLLKLYDVPDADRLFGGPVRLLVMSNASRDRDGSRRMFAETVPNTITSALEAAAWQFGVDVKTYAELQRST